MYTVLLAVALTAGPAETPNWGCRGCWGCHGCCGCSGCHGCWGCHGCHGCWGCHGCYGCGGCLGCSSWACSGCSCYGCGCYSCGCYGCGCYGCAGCSCYGCGGCYGGVVVATPVRVVPATPAPPADLPKSGSLGTPATVVVSLPAEATLFVDGDRVPMTTATRTFQTPPLSPGQEYYYTMKAEAVRNGEKVEKSTRVIVRAGETARADFGDLSEVAKTTRDAAARITVKLPADAKLFVDDVACTLTSDTRTFETPKLDAGKKYGYTLRAEAVRDGQTVTATRKVVMTAGEALTVQFEDLGSVRTASR